MPEDEKRLGHGRDFIKPFMLIIRPFTLLIKLSEAGERLGHGRDSLRSHSFNTKLSGKEGGSHGAPRLPAVPYDIIGSRNIV